MKKPIMKIEKGMLIGAMGEWYVVVEAIWVNEELHLHCICDHSNNIHSFTPDDIDAFMTLKEVGEWDWNMYQIDRLRNPYFDRGFPHGVMVEVLSGKHDDRFDHWKRG